MKAKEGKCMPKALGICEQALVLASMFTLCSCTTDKPEYCTVKGSIEGVRNGTHLVLQDNWNHFKVIDKAVVKNGAYEFHPTIDAPTHVYLFTKDGRQLRDFFLEPGTIVANVNADDEEDYAEGATGTISNDTWKRIHEQWEKGGRQTADSLKSLVLQAEKTGTLALYYAQKPDCPAVKGLAVLERLTLELAARPYVAELREELTRRMKTEPRVNGSTFVPLFIDMEYPDGEGKPVSLSSVVQNTANRFVLVDFWATWCGPCRKAIPYLKELYARYHAKGLEIYSVSEDEDAKGWKEFVKKNEMTWLNVRDNQPGRSKSKAWNDYALFGIPTLVLIDCPSGEIVARDDKEEINRLLADNLQ